MLDRNEQAFSALSLRARGGQDFAVFNDSTVNARHPGALKFGKPESV